MKKQIVEQIEKMSGRYSPYTIFSDWVEMMAISIQNTCQQVHDSLWKQREKDYMDICGRYEKKEIIAFGEMMGMLVITLDEQGPRDILGEIYMESGCGSKYTGQFFTPWHLSLLSAKLMDFSNDKVHTVNEPSCGGGGMILAVAAVMKERGIDYQKMLKVVAQDLDWKAVYMTYVQLSLLGINGIVTQGNTLAEPNIEKYPRYRIFRTPANMGALI